MEELRDQWKDVFDGLVIESSKYCGALYRKSDLGILEM
jgi:hypothetical protein